MVGWHGICLHTWAYFHEHGDQVDEACNDVSDNIDQWWWVYEEWGLINSITGTSTPWWGGQPLPRKNVDVDDKERWL